MNNMIPDAEMNEMKLSNIGLTYSSNMLPVGFTVVVVVVLTFGFFVTVNGNKGISNKII